MIHGTDRGVFQMDISSLKELVPSVFKFMIIRSILLVLSYSETKQSTFYLTVTLRATKVLLQPSSESFPTDTVDATESNRSREARPATAAGRSARDDTALPATDSTIGPKLDSDSAVGSCAGDGGNARHLRRRATSESTDDTQLPGPDCSIGPKGELSLSYAERGDVSVAVMD